VKIDIQTTVPFPQLPPDMVGNVYPVRGGFGARNGHFHVIIAAYDKVQGVSRMAGCTDFDPIRTTNKLTVEQCDRDATIRATEHFMDGSALAEIGKGEHDAGAMVQAFTRHRQQAEARTEGLVAALEQYQDQFCEGLCDGGPHFEFDCAGCPAGKALTAYRSAKP
jgi:hypothetical protein